MDTPSQVSKSLNKLVDDVRGKPEQNIIEQLAIRTMAKAIYTTKNIGHYGLGFDHYTHFISLLKASIISNLQELFPCLYPESFLG